MSFRRIPLILLLAGLIVFLCLRLADRAPESGDPVSRESERRREDGEPRGAREIPPDAKASKRSPEAKPSIEETLAALKATLPGWTEFPEQTLQERILACNARLKKAGSALRFGVDERLYPSNNLLEMKVPAFSQENATPNDILQHDVKALERHYMLSDGMVLFQDGSGG